MANEADVDDEHEDETFPYPIPAGLHVIPT